jgi:hypothetical protein
LFFIRVHLLTSHLLRKKMGASFYCFVVSLSGAEGMYKSRFLFFKVRLRVLSLLFFSLKSSFNSIFTL